MAIYHGTPSTTTYETKRVALTIDHADVATGAGAQTFDLLELSSDIVVLAAGAARIEEWAGGTLSACTISIGEDSTPDVDGYLAAFDVFTGSGTGPAAGTKGALLTQSTTYQPLLASGQKLTATVTPTDDDLENATAGTTAVWVIYREVP